MLYAAAVTFVINFFAGSLGMISMPSMIIPGCGALLAVFRATLWGILLGPSETTLAYMMLPHTGTLLLEGGGYILAAFFALLIPVYLFGSGRAVPKPPWSMSGRRPKTSTSLQGRRPRSGSIGALLLNLKGNLLVAMVLAVAACYEAVEVILMAGF